MRYYECTVILAPELSKQQISQVQVELGSIIENFNGKTSKHEYWGLRSTAYPIERFTRAHYIYFNIEAEPNAVIELERKMKIREDVLRYLTVRIDAINDDPSVMMQAKLKDEARKESKENRDNKDNNNKSSKELA